MPKKWLNHRSVKTINYFGRPGLQELFEKLIDDQTDERFFNISLVGPPGIGKGNLVFAAAEHIAYAKKKSVLWMGCRVKDEKWAVKLFSDGDLSQLPVSKSLDEIWALPPVSNVEVLVVDAPTRANTSNGNAGITAFEWAGKAERGKGRDSCLVSGVICREADRSRSINLQDLTMRPPSQEVITFNRFRIPS